MKKIVKIGLTGWVCFSALPAFAEGDGGQAGLFLRYGVGGRALGMGRAFVAVSDDASGVYWNPAGIVSAGRTEISTMYSNLYYDSQFAHFGFVLPRPSETVKNRIARFLAGPASAIGFNWVGLGMSGFEQRTATGQLIGDFGIGENGFLLGWAHESVGLWGILQYGLNFKLVNQNFSGLASISDQDFGEIHRDWSGGMDLGFTFQPIHTPVLKVVALKYLLPLKVGVSFQNVIRPHWSGDAERDKFPTTIRAGLSYRFHMKDWLPSSWDLTKPLKDVSFLLAVDKEYISDLSSGTYVGVEGYWPLFGDVLFQPRFGVNNQTENFCAGAGLSIPFTSVATLRLDYAIADHPYLQSDSRFFMTVSLGSMKKSSYFKKLSRRPENTANQTQDDLLRMLALYPNDDVTYAVGMLSESADTSHARRYYELTGGLGRADYLLADTRQLLKENKIGKARKRAVQAAEEYTPLFMQPDNPMKDADLIDFGEALIFAGHGEDAIPVLEEVENQNLRTEFLLATAKRQSGDLEGALELFQQAVRRYESEQDYMSMVSLSFFQIGEILLDKQQYESARLTFDVLLKNHTRALDPDYPRVEIFKDDYCLDDAQFLSGLAELFNQQYEEGVSDVMQTLRFYPDLEYGKAVSDQVPALLSAMSTQDWKELETITHELYYAYQQAHAIDAE